MDGCRFILVPTLGRTVRAGVSEERRRVPMDVWVPSNGRQGDRNHGATISMIVATATENEVCDGL